MNILLVEDSPGDVRLITEVFRETAPSVCLHVANDGAEALAFLRREGLYPRSPRPDLIMLDLNMPKIDGRALLAIIKQDARLKLIPTIILTSSDAAEDIQAGHAFQAKGYLRKPVEYDQFMDVVKSIRDYWLDLFDPAFEKHMM
jgi:two-component system, chemotaxis family, response regulator Rcp1